MKQSIHPATRTIGTAYRLAKTRKPAGFYATEIAYDSKNRIWNAWFTDNQLKQVGFIGRGIDPVSAVEDLILVNNKDDSNKPTPEGRFTL